MFPPEFYEIGGFAKVSLFLSHAKADGETLAETLRDYVESTSVVQTFFDANDIAPGFDSRVRAEKIYPTK